MLKTAASNVGRLARVFKHSQPALLFSDRFHLSAADSSPLSGSSDPPCLVHRRHLSSGAKIDFTVSNVMPRALFSSEAAVEPKVETTETVKELYDKILKSVNVQRTAPPNAWLWSLIESCANVEDIKLLFDVLQNLRRFRLSNLRIHDNFNENLCREVAKACVRVGAIDFGKKALWKHNVYGLTPSVGSAHHLLMYAKQNNDANLMVEVVELLKKNDVQLRGGTADLVFSICYNTDEWDLISKYSKRFIREGVKLWETSFNAWMEFSAQRGDTKSVWYIEMLRMDSGRRRNLSTSFSCTKAFLLERNPEKAAETIYALREMLPEAKNPGILVELQKLVSHWTVKVIKCQKEEDRKDLAAALQADIPAMITKLVELGLEVNVNTEDLLTKDLLC
ncbi:RING finger and CHY zinc finger domain-containing protein 1 [Heracleum sosnowskyi]|uniref:RING finger and CHY zinc finger domain-containing protein 1 n=1 Tax=Heracleum sosnowskyi TaxID=360622 RepID=A0AAD8MZG2_9APIA|nr:RING finger and CHY zinc finger domain-containing protein 1 [Heracleum sosnowskyi]